MTAQQVIDALGLVPLAGEGGMYRQTYASARTLDGAAAGTAIYYLLTEHSFSHLHRLTGDEMYHFYLGDAVELCELLPDGAGRVTVLGHVAGLAPCAGRQMGAAGHHDVPRLHGQRV